MRGSLGNREAWGKLLKFSQLQLCSDIFVNKLRDSLANDCILNNNFVDNTKLLYSVLDASLVDSY
jgi:hypothetical protein